nr:GAF domain-containing protein [Rubrobacteraceae bacterium]
MTPPVKKVQRITPSSSKDRREVERLAALEYLRAVQPEVDHVLQELVDEVRGVFGTDLCLVDLALTEVQYFRAWSGELPPDKAEARQDSIENSMCQYVVNSEMPFVVEDFLATEEFREQYWHVNYGIRFYAGTPLITSAGPTIGTLCLLSTQSVEFGKEQMRLLGAFARAVVGRLELLGALEREQAAREEEA